MGTATHHGVDGVEVGSYHLGRLAAFLGADLLGALDELHDGDLLRRMEAQLAGEPTWQTKRFGSVWDLRLYRIGLYALVRATRPGVFVETGVLHGLTSAFLLEALERNGEGRLLSVDLPSYAETGPANADGYDATLPPGREPGWAVPDDLRGRWDLHLGASLEVLPRALPSGGIGAFLHDSEHTEATMRGELELAWEALRPGGLLICDNALDTTAFEDFCRRVVREPLMLPAPDLRPAKEVRWGLIRR
ncbi:MAG TPA: class I SAM-dependent methyltransferase [Capillimicrobium sp.]|nr:class I SAM-dependent methyltransferase [Capillimicrobium sp.]